jgi:hypothetical protein
MGGEIEEPGRNMRDRDKQASPVVPQENCASGAAMPVSNKRRICFGERMFGAPANALMAPRSLERLLALAKIEREGLREKKSL